MERIGEDYTVKIEQTKINSEYGVKSKRLKRKEFLFGLLTTFLLLGLFVSPVAAKVTELQISPFNPAIGETVTVKGKASPGESLTGKVSINQRAPVSGGRYRLAVISIKIPSGMNSFTVTASGVKNLHIKVGPINLQSQASKGGTATITVTHVPSLTYNIVFDGDARSKSAVNLVISASKTLKADSNGKFKFSVDTASMPAGVYTVSVGNKVSIVQLGPKGHGSGNNNWNLGESLTALLSWLKQLGSK